MCYYCHTYDNSASDVAATKAVSEVLNDDLLSDTEDNLKYFNVSFVRYQALVK